MASKTYMTDEEFRLFERGSWVYPHPVALSCGRIVRSRSPETLLDALLTKQRSLIEGGKSQCRNPLIARALRLIGFAELAGSGLRQLQHVWRTNNRRPPQMESNSSANTFTLTLDWRTIPDNYNEFWKERLGFKLLFGDDYLVGLATTRILGWIWKVRYCDGFVLVFFAVSTR